MRQHLINCRPRFGIKIRHPRQHIQGRWAQFFAPEAHPEHGSFLYFCIGHLRRKPQSIPPVLIIDLLIETLRDGAKIAKVLGNYFLLWRDAGFYQTLVIVQYEEFAAS